MTATRSDVQEEDNLDMLKEGFVWGGNVEMEEITSRSFITVPQIRVEKLVTTK